MRIRQAFPFIGLALALFALFSLPLWTEDARAQQLGSIYCSQNAQYAASTNGSTRIFQASATSSSSIFICGYVINVGGTATNVGLQYGTGTNCGTGTTALTPSFVLPIAGQIKEDSPIFRGLSVPPNKDLCIVTSAGNPVQAIVYYTYQQ